MATIQNNISVAVPATAAFAFVVDWRNISRFYEGVRELKPLSTQTGIIGARYAYELKSPVVGYLSVETELREVVPDCSLTFVTDQGGDSVERWRFDPVPDRSEHTHLTYTLTYTVPVPLVGSMLDALFIKRVWEKRVARSLQTLKTLLENSESALSPDK